MKRTWWSRARVLLTLGLGAVTASGACGGNSSASDDDSSSGASGAGEPGGAGGSSQGGATSGRGGSSAGSSAEGGTSGSAGAGPGDCDAPFVCDGADRYACTDGDLLLVEQCATAALCNTAEGRCEPPVCDAGQRCRGPILEECNADRTGYSEVETCASSALCDVANGACLDPACDEGEFRCQGSVLEACAVDRTGFDSGPDCGTADLCDDVNGECDVACTPDAYQCDGAVLLRCNAAGTALGVVESCASAALCNAAEGRCDLPACTTTTGGECVLTFQPAQEHMARVAVPYETAIADVNGDGRDDLVWNHRSGSLNTAYVGLGNVDGTLTPTAAVTHPESAAEGWGNYDLLIGDVDADDDDDLVWNHRSVNNVTYVALSDGDGTFTYPAPFTHPAMGWGPYLARAADVDGDGRADLVWNSLTDSENRVYVALSNGNGSWNALGFQDRGGSDWAGYTLMVGDLNRDGRADLVWNETPADNTLPNRTYTAIASAAGDGSLVFGPARDHPAGGWAPYRALLGDTDGDSAADLVWNSATGTENRTYVALFDGTDAWQFLSAQDHTISRDWSAFTQHLADVNGDGSADLVWNELGSTNRTMVGLAVGDGTFNLEPLQQDHPEALTWSVFTLHVADVNGDSRDDLVWNHGASTNRVFVALGSPP